MNGSLMDELHVTEVKDVDPEILATIRVDAMRPSLEAVGRFDPIRARERFLSTFSPNETRLIHLQNDLVGFYVVRRRPDHLYLHHLYIRTDRQGLGLGRKIVNQIQKEAKDAKLPIKLIALKNSHSNAFYVSCGFVLQSSDELDNYYQWRAPDAE